MHFSMDIFVRYSLEDLYLTNGEENLGFCLGLASRLWEAFFLQLWPGKQNELKRNEMPYKNY